MLEDSEWKMRPMGWREGWGEGLEEDVVWIGRREDSKGLIGIPRGTPEGPKGRPKGRGVDKGSIVGDGSFGVLDGIIGGSKGVEGGNTGGGRVGGGNMGGGRLGGGKLGGGRLGGGKLGGGRLGGGKLGGGRLFTLYDSTGWIPTTCSTLTTFAGGIPISFSYFSLIILSGTPDIPYIFISIDSLPSIALGTCFSVSLCTWVTWTDKACAELSFLRWQSE